MSDRRRARTQYASDDHANDLLADILDATEEEAAAEQALLERSLRAKRESEDLRKAELHAQKIADRQAKLDQEMERQAALAERRTLRMQALTAPPAEAAPPQQDTAVLDEAAIRRKITEELREELRIIAQTPMPEPTFAPLPPPTRSRAYAPLAAAAALLIAGGLGVAAFAMSTGYSPDPTSYAKAVFAPTDRAAVAVEMAAVPLPKAAPAPTEEPAARSRVSVRQPRVPKKVEAEKPKSIFGAPAGKSDARKSFEQLEGMLGEDVLGLDKK